MVALKQVLEIFPRLRTVKKTLVVGKIVNELGRFTKYSAPALFNELVKEYNDNRDREFVPCSKFLDVVVAFAKQARIYTMDENTLAIEIKTTALLKCGRRISIIKKIINENGTILENINLEW